MNTTRILVGRLPASPFVSKRRPTNVLPLFKQPGRMIVPSRTRYLSFKRKVSFTKKGKKISHSPTPIPQLHSKIAFQMAVRRRITPIQVIPAPDHDEDDSTTICEVPTTPTTPKNPERTARSLRDKRSLFAILIAILLLVAFGLTLLIWNHKHTRNFLTYFSTHFSDYDCGDKPITILQARLPPTLLLDEYLYFLPNLGLSFLLSSLYIGLLIALGQLFAAWTAIVGGLLAATSAALLYWYNCWQAGLIASFFSVMSLLCYFSWNKTARLSGTIVCCARRIALYYPGIFLLSAASGISTFLLYAAFAYLIKMVRELWFSLSPACSTKRNPWFGTLIGLSFLSSLFFYWVTQFTLVYFQACTSACTRAWFVRKREGADKSVLRRSIWYLLRFSMGSLARGSLILSLTWILRDLGIAALQLQFAGSASMLQHSASGLLMMMLLYLQPNVEQIQQVFNDWSFALLESEELDYYLAFKAGSNLMMGKGLQWIGDESAVLKVFDYIPFAVGGTCAVTMYLTAIFAAGPIKSTSDVVAADVLTALAFLGGIQIARAVMAPFKGVVVTLWILMAREPEAFKEDHTEMWEALMEMRPEVANGLMA